MTDNTSPKHNTMEKEIEINDPFFDELQAVWDEHRRRVDRIVAATDTLSQFDFRRYEAYRQREIATHLLLTLVGLLLLVAAVVTMGRHRFDTPLQAIAVMVAAVSLAVVVHGVGILARLLTHRYDTRRLRFSSPQMLAFVATIVFSLTTVSCTPVGDGHTITQNIPDRIESVDTVTTILRLS